MSMYFELKCPICNTEESREASECFDQPLCRICLRRYRFFTPMELVEIIINPRKGLPGISFKPPSRAETANKRRRSSVPKGRRWKSRK